MLADQTRDTDDRPSVEETYERATNTSNLKQEPERRTAADTLRDMAMSADTLATALRRLRSQWEQAEKPIRRRARSPKDFLTDGSVTTKEVAELAHTGEKSIFDAWFMRDTERLLGELSEYPKVRAALAVQALRWGMVDAEGKAAAVLRYWLNQNCPACGGTKWELYAGTTRQSTKACRVCAGSGIAAVPHGQEGRKLANHLDQCLRGQLRGAQSRKRMAPDAVRAALSAIPATDRLSKRAQERYSQGEED